MKIKDTVLPVLLAEQRPMTARELYAFSEHPDIQLFSSGLSRLVQRGMLVSDGGRPCRYCLSPLGEAQAIDPRKARRDAWQRRREMLGLAPIEDAVTPERPPVESVRVRKASEAPEMIQKPRTLEEQIISIMVREGAITIDEVHSLSRTIDDYFSVKGCLLRFMNAGYAELDTSTYPMMFYLTEQGENYFRISMHQDHEG